MPFAGGSAAAAGGACDPDGEARGGAALAAQAGLQRNGTLHETARRRLPPLDETIGSQAEVLTTSSVGAGPPTHAYRLRATAADFRRLDTNAQHYLAMQDFVATLPRAGAKAAGAKSQVLAKVSARARVLAKQRQQAKQMGRTKSIHSEGRGKKERTQ